MTLPVSGGVPEQGLRDALEIIERHAALWAQSAEIYECSAPHDTLSKATCVGVRDTLRTIASEMRAALERPRPAPDDQSGGEYCNGCGKPAFRCECVRAALPAEHAPPDLAPIVRDLISALWTQTRLVCTEQDHPRTMRCQSCASRESIDRAEAALRGSRPALAGSPEPSNKAIAAYWRAWSLHQSPVKQQDSQDAHLAGLRAAYAEDFGT